uniref:Uncharacterized protein n=1 Tax=Anguilla anguilla TaxID=7936 RepID=A0A0E9TJ76_ANGAN
MRSKMINKSIFTEKFE